jgi:hypothetical protein
MKELRNEHRKLTGNPEGQAPFTRNRRQNRMTISYAEGHRILKTLMAVEICEFFIGCC